MGHCPQDEAPELVNSILQDWLLQMNVSNPPLEGDGVIPRRFCERFTSFVLEPVLTQLNRDVRTKIASTFDAHFSDIQGAANHFSAVTIPGRRCESHPTVHSPLSDINVAISKLLKSVD